ncbi:MAG: oxidoreductase [Gammaproteobacteria bacterium]|nr:oxidoreductase [Gammaproteobacteria bacterium]
MICESRLLGVVTGASAGIGLELARLCAKANYDLVIAADRPEIEEAAGDLSGYGSLVIPVQCNLSTPAGGTELVSQIESTGRPVDVLLANAGHRVGGAFLDQDTAEALEVAHANVDGTLYLLHRVGRQMRQRGRGRILITGSPAGLLPGTFSTALAHELENTGVTVTCLLPKTGTEEMADAADLAKTGFDAMMRGESTVGAGFADEVRAAVVPDGVLALTRSPIRR